MKHVLDDHTKFQGTFFSSELSNDVEFEILTDTSQLKVSEEPAAAAAAAAADGKE